MVPAPTVEALKDEWNLVRRNAHPIVRDGEGALGGTPLAGDTNDQPRRWILFDGVFDQVREELVPIKAVAIDDPAALREIDDDLCIPPFEDGCEAINRILNTIPHGKWLHIEDTAGAFESGNREHVINNADDALPVLFHDAQAFGDELGVSADFTPQRLDVAQNEGEWRAQFVGGVGHEVFADLFRHDLIRDVLNHQPGTAFR